MPKEITQIKPSKPIIQTKKRVAAYARVSMETDRQWHSLSAQVSRYSTLIQSNPDWEFKGVFTDYGISGTSVKKRTEFLEMLEECDKGNIDLILTKSIKRFARNTVDLLEVVRDLKDKGIEVQFENEHISTMSGDGELMLTILASFAQEESRSISENVKWGIKKRFEQGIPNGKFNLYGYQWIGDELVIIEEEAEVVRRIYTEYLKGKSRIQIGRDLMADGIYTRQGNDWVDSNVKALLCNIHYTGNLLFQKEYVVDPITQKSKLNRGELPQYFVENTHQAIIPKEMFDQVQAELKRRKEAGVFGNPSIKTTELTSKIRCQFCGRSFQKASRKLVSGRMTIWMCATRKAGQGNPCKTGDLNGQVLKQMICEVLGIDEYSPKAVEEHIDHIDVVKKEKLIFHLKDGRIVEKAYRQLNRKDYFTEEVKARISEQRKDKHRFRTKRRVTPFTGLLRCGNCGESFDSQKRPLHTGEFIRYLSCRTPSHICPRNTIKEPTLKGLVCDVLSIKEFDEKTMDEHIERIFVANNTVRFLFKDGHEETRTYREKKLGATWSKERREKFQQSIKNRRSEKNGCQESHHHTSNN